MKFEKKASHTAGKERGMRCPKCGHEQADGILECGRCRIIFSKWARASERAAAAAAAAAASVAAPVEGPAGGRPRAFNARAIYALSPDRVFRVYATDHELFFIRIGGQNLGSGVGPQFGLVGALVGVGLERLSEKSGQKQAERTEDFDRRAPAELLPEHKHNFRLERSDIVESAIDRAPHGLVARVQSNTTGLWMGLHGPLAGRWAYKTRDGKKLDMEFPTLEDMKSAMGTLGVWLGARLAIHVQWDDQRKAFIGGSGATQPN
jgi:hypothetical protein